MRPLCENPRKKKTVYRWEVALTNLRKTVIKLQFGCKEYQLQTQDDRNYIKHRYRSCQ